MDSFPTVEAAGLMLDLFHFFWGQASWLIAVLFPALAGFVLVLYCLHSIDKVARLLAVFL